MTHTTPSPTDAMNQMASAASANFKSLFNSAASTKTISGGRRRGRKSRRVKSKKSTKKHKRKTPHRRKKSKGMSFNLF